MRLQGHRRGELAEPPLQGRREAGQDYAAGLRAVVALVHWEIAKKHSTGLGIVGYGLNGESQQLCGFGMSDFVSHYMRLNLGAKIRHC